jgi:hypothetical protein
MQTRTTKFEIFALGVKVNSKSKQVSRACNILDILDLIASNGPCFLANLIKKFKKNLNYPYGLSTTNFVLI